MAESAQSFSQSVTWVHARFSAAQAAVDAGDLPTALQVLQPLQGIAGAPLQEWTRAAEARLATDRALALARARVVLLLDALC